MNLKYSYLLFLLLMPSLFSCINEDEFTTNPSAILQFSEDTVRFDTIVSTIGSSTKTLYVFNKNKSGLRIKNVSLQEGANSHFRVNVDGQFLSGGKGEDFEVCSKCSLIVRIEVTLPESGKVEPQSYMDNLTFQLESGTTQQVVLTAGAIDAYQVHGMYVTQNTTLETDKPYVIYDSLVIAEGATLTLKPGTKLMFHDKCGIDVYGKLLCYGELDKNVVLRGDRLDHMFDYLFYDNTPSRWEGITIHKGSFGNTFQYTDLHSACYGIVCEETTPDKLCLDVDNSIIHNIGGDGVQLNNCQALFTNTQISNTLGRTVSITGGATQFVHCTIAQFYPFSANRKEALFLTNKNEADEFVDIKFAQFINSVITGYGDDVIMGNIEEYQDLVCPYLFHHCYLNTPEVDDSRYVNCVWDRPKKDDFHAEKNFVLFDTDNFFYDFTPVAESRIRETADAELNIGDLDCFRIDRLGRVRDASPDAGCYEYIEPEE